MDVLIIIAIISFMSFLFGVYIGEEQVKGGFGLSRRMSDELKAHLQRFKSRSVRDRLSKNARNRNIRMTVETDF